MTKLLVSVRDAGEAAEALGGGAHLIDVKEPRRGPLGAALPEDIQAVQREVGKRTPLSAALGELLDEVPSMSFAVLSGYSFAKLGLWRCAEIADWPQRWSARLSQLPEGVGGVAVIYADYLSAGAPRPMQVMQQAGLLGLKAMLVDTFDKRRGSLLDHLSLNELDELIRVARQLRMSVVLAGSLRAHLLPQLSSLAPDYIAVRGAVCRDDRTGCLDSSLVRDLVQKLMRKEG